MKYILPKYIPHFFLVISLLFVLTGCDKEEPVPAWLVIEDYDVVTFQGQGTNRHQIQDVYVYTPSRFLGVYPIPCRIPILEEGEISIDVFPGIRANGILALPDVYGFLGRYTTQVNLQPNQFDTIRPQFEYDPVARIRFIDDFEGSVKVFSETREGIPAQVDTDTVFEGSGSGRLTVDQTNRICEVVSPPFTEVPLNGTPNYLEMHYKNEVVFFVGIAGISQGTGEYVVYEVGLKPSDTWKKVYISLEDIITRNLAEVVRVAIRAEMPPGDERTEANVWIDNVKFIHQ